MNDRNCATGPTGQVDAVPNERRSSRAVPEIAQPSERQPPLPRRLRWITVLLSGIFLLLGALFVLAPGAAAGFYGLDADAPSALFYVRVIGVRDAALAIYLFGLVLAKLRRALSIVAFGTLIIPAGDILLLAASGAGKPVHYLLHAGSLICFAGLACWSRVKKRNPRPISY